MEGSDFKKFLFFSSLTGLGFWGLKWSFKKVQNLKEKKEKLMEQGGTYTPAMLDKIKEGFTEDFAMISGVCINKDSLKMQNPELKLISIRKNVKLYTVKYQ